MKDLIIVVSFIVSFIVSLGITYFRYWLLERRIFSWLDGKGLPPEVTIPEGFIKDIDSGNV